MQKQTLGFPGYFCMYMLQKRKNIFRESLVLYERDDSPLFPTLKPVLRDHLEEQETLNDVEVAPLETDTVPAPVEEPIEETRHVSVHYSDPSSLSVVTVFKRLFLAAPVFAFVFALVFSLNATYTSNLIKQGVASVASSTAVETVNTEILLPYKLVAKKLQTSIDDVIYGLVHKDNIYPQ